jgi:hypothetical protein
MVKAYFWRCLPVAVIASVALQASCGGDDGSTFPGHNGDGGNGDSTLSDDGGGNTFGDGSGDASQLPDIEPSTLQTITVTAGQTTPTVTYTATFGGQPYNVSWSTDRGNLGTIPVGPTSTAAFTPTGSTGGLVNVLASVNGKVIQRPVMIKLTATQNGYGPGEQGQVPTTTGQLSAGGGVGGVGGEGLGGAVTDPGTLSGLQSPSGNGQTQKLGYLYPYDKTVWPRGMLAPLLMWSWTINDADAIQIQLSTTSGSFSWTGTFSRPSILSQTGGPFIRHPIPQDIWDMATNTAGGPTTSGTTDQLTVGLTVAKGGQGYGPISETWNVAAGRLTGTVYYNSYGTQYVKNWTSLDGANHPVGAAILGIHSGDTAPKLIVGQNSPLNAQGNPTDDTGCRVCHVVASRGRWLLTQSEQGSPTDGRSFLYDLTAANVQGSVVQFAQEGVFAWAAMQSDGSYALSNSINPSSTNPALTGSSGGTATSSFWKFGASPASAPLSGLPSPIAAGYPSYSPNDKYMTYIDVTGHTQNVQGPLVVAAYNAATQAFSAPSTIHTPQAGQRIGYPVFLPDDSGILFETELRTSQTDQVMVTRDGARSELWWITTGSAPTATALATLNGKGYLPIGANNHGIAGAPDPRSTYNETGQDDTTLSYEPTVLPLVAGGYAWVVFTSRRMYGNQLTAVPWQSWPPDYDTTNLGVATVKKLWVAAIDLSAPPGSDPSHPAFYLPAQEILAGNSRGFWVLDPCKQDGQSCQSGDQCCNGYCEPNGDGGALVCSQPPSNNCAGLQDKCTPTIPCCDPTNQCINGFCAQPNK